MSFTFIQLCNDSFFSLLEKAKLMRGISDGENEIPHKFLGRKFNDGIREGFHVFPH